MAKKIFLISSILFLFSLSASASTVFVIDSTYNGHGNKVCSIIREQAPNARVEFIRVSNSAGVSTSALINAIYGVIDRVRSDSQLRQQGVVLNLSLGSPHYSESLARAIKAAQNAGIVVVAAAGNDGGKSPNYPAALPGVISVGALERGSPAYYSNRGDLWAPTKYAGTSFSAPYVAGVIANTMDRNNISARAASNQVLGTARANNGVVGSSAVALRTPQQNRTPIQTVPDEKIIYRLLAFVYLARTFGLKDIIPATVPVFASGFAFNRDRTTNSHNSSRFTPVYPIYKGRDAFSGYFR